VGVKNWALEVYRKFLALMRLLYKDLITRK